MLSSPRLTPTSPKVVPVPATPHKPASARADAAHQGWMRLVTPANAITAARLLMVLGLAGFIGAPGMVSTWAGLISGIALMAWVLDGVDGLLARRLGQCTAFGARFDVETDTVAIIVFSGLLVSTGVGGAWLLAVAALRYGFAIAGWLVPMLARPLAPSRRRQWICGLHVGALAMALGPWVPEQISELVLALSSSLLVLSFAVDIRDLSRHPRNQIVQMGAPQ